MLNVERAFANNLIFPCNVKGTFEHAALVAAVESAVMTYPLMRANVCRDTNGEESFCFFEERKVPITVVERRDALQWSSIVKTEFYKQFDLERDALLKVIWLRAESESELIFICSHTIADGRSLIFFIDTVFRLLSAEQSSTIPQCADDIVFDEEQPVAIKQSLPEKIKHESLFFLLRSAQNILSVFRQKFDLNDIGMLHLQFSEKQSKALVRQARQNNTTVNALLLALFISSVEVIDGKNKRRVMVPVDYRKAFDLKMQDALRLMSYSVEFLQCQNHDNFWSFARSIKLKTDALTSDSEVKASLAALSSNQRVMALLTPAFLKKQQHYNKRNSVLFLTNLGVLPLQKKYKALTIDVLFLPVMHVGSLYGVSAYSFAGRLSISLTWFSNVYPKETIQSLLNDVRSKALRLIE